MASSKKYKARSDPSSQTNKKFVYNHRMKLPARILRHERLILWLMIGLYFVAFTAICLWKYGLFAYDGLDLAIYSQVFWNTLHGQPFGLTIHPHSYLGDHAEFGLLTLLPLYALKSDPRTLLVLQTAALALTAWPIWLLARHRLANASGLSRLAPLAFAAAWLLSPLVQNMNLFEFHLLPFALPPLLLALLAYDERRPFRFALWALVAMLFREDVSLVVAAVGLLAVLERRGWRWTVGPIVLGAAWFVMATGVAAHFAPSGSYKFLIYYAWLGEAHSFADVAMNALSHPLKVLAHTASLGNLEMLLGFLLPLLFLPLLSPKRLILLTGPLLQILLGSPGGSTTIVQTHYSTLFLPGLFLAAMSGLPKLNGPLRRYLTVGQAKTLGALLLVMGAAYGSLALGPLPAVAARIWSGDGREAAADARRIVDQVPPNASVAASYRLLPELSSRSAVYSAHYLFLGVEQFDTGPYPTPDGVQMLAFDENDLSTYRAQFLLTSWAQPHYKSGRERLGRSFGTLPQDEAGGFALYGPIWSSSSYLMAPPFDTPPMRMNVPWNFADGSQLNAVQSKLTADKDKTRLHLQSVWRLGPTADALQIDLTLIDTDGQEVWHETMPLVNELWQPIELGSEYERYIDYLLPQLRDKKYRLQLELFNRTEVHGLDGLLSGRQFTIEERSLGRFEVESNLDF